MGRDGHGHGGRRVVFFVWPGILRLVEPFGLLPSLDDGESGARARLAFRILVQGACNPLPGPCGN
jgi:hypothetical protein